MKRHVNLNRLWIALSTVFVIGLIFTYYFLVYVPDNEEWITAKKYRTLKRIGQNFVIMKDDYERAVRQQLWDHINDEDKLIKPKCPASDDLAIKNRELDRLKNRLKVVSNDSKRETGDLEKIDSIIRKLDDVDKQIRILKKSEEECKGTQSALKRLNLSPLELAMKDTWFNDRISKPDMLFFFSGRQGTTLKLADFIEGQTLLNHFDRFLVVRLFDNKKHDAWRNNLKKIPRHERNERPDSLYAFLAYQGKSYSEIPGSDNKILLGNIRAVFDQSHGLNSIPLRTVHISGMPYRMFSHIIEMEPDEDWILLGLLKEADIKKESRKVQLILIIFMVLGSLFLLLAMPVIKLFVMSPIERLQISNVWFLGFSIVIGTSVAFMMLLVAHHHQTNKANFEKQLDSLSDTVASHFIAEISAIIDQLKQPPKAIGPHHLKVDYPAFFLREKTLEDTSYYNDPYPFYNETLLLDSVGNSLFLLATHAVPSQNKITNLTGRQYFENALAHKLHTLATKEPLPPFTIQSILSWNSRAHEAGISIRRPDDYPAISTHTWDPSPALKVLAIATKLRSVMDPLLSPGFSFCIIDEKGEVLFHSQKDKNLQENFYEESEENRKILAAIDGRLEISLTTEYAGKKTLAHIRPLSNLPLFLVTLYDEDYYNIPIVFTLGVVIALVSVFFLIQGIHLMILYTITYESSKLRIKRFFLNWLRPHLSEGTNARAIEIKAPLEAENPPVPPFPALQIPHHERYLRAITSMVIVALFLIAIAFLDMTSARVLIISTLTIPIILSAFFFTMLHDNQKTVETFLGASGLLLVLINFLAIPFLKWQIIHVLIIQAIVTLSIWIGVWSPPYHSWLTTTFNKISGPTRYVLFLTTWLFMVSIIPVAFIYKASHKRESLIWERFLQWETINLIERRNSELVLDFQRLAPASINGPNYGRLKNRFFREADQYGSYIALVPESRNEHSSAVPMHFTDVEKAEFFLRPESDGPLESSRKALLANSHDKPWKWFLNENKLTVKTLPGADSDKKTEMHSVVQPFKFISGQYKVLSILFLLTLSIVIYKLVRSSTKYIFGLGLLLPNKRTYPQNVQEIVHRILKPASKYRQFIVGLPYSGKAKIVKAAVAALSETSRQERSNRGTQFKTEEFDFRSDRELPSIEPGKNILYIVKHFEYGINDDDMNEFRLKVIEYLEEHPNLKIIISSSVEPSLIMEVYEKKIEKLVAASNNDENDTANIRKHLASLRTSYRKWKHILAGFEVDHLSFCKPLRNTLKDSELSFGTFLPTLKSRFNPEKGKEEEFILDVEEAASTYYHALWNSFSRNEKRILFDLAKDQFINLRDINPIRLLMKKGIILMDDAPRIMNRSFTNFILSVVGEDEEVAMNNELKQKGTWQTVQLILVITIIGVIAFVALVQQEILSNLNATIATISGVIALLLRFSGFFVGEKVKGTQ